MCSVLAVVAASAACSVERTSTVLGPTGSTTTTSGARSSAPSLLGTWVVQGASSTPKATASSLTSLPDFSSCSNFQWTVANQTATEASGSFSAECDGGLSLQGDITGKMGGPTIPIVITGALKSGSDSCSFSLNGEGTPIDAVTFHIIYSGTTCLGPLQGANNLSLAPHSAPTAFTLSGTITDGTSGGILPDIEVSAPGVAVRSDGAGHYQLPGVPAGAVTVQFAAASYVTQTKALTLNENAVVDVVLQRVVPPAPAPAPAPTSTSGDQIDLHSAIVRGPGGDVANWPVTTRIRVLDANFGGFSVDFDAKSRWPEVVPPGWDGGIQVHAVDRREDQRPVGHGRRGRVPGAVSLGRAVRRRGWPPTGTTTRRCGANWQPISRLLASRWASLSPPVTSAPRTCAPSPNDRT